MSFLNWLKNVVSGKSAIVDDSPRIEATAYNADEDNNAGVGLNLPVQRTLRIVQANNGLRLHWHCGSATIHTLAISASAVVGCMRHGGYVLPYGAGNIGATMGDGDIATVSTLLAILHRNEIVVLRNNLIELADGVTLI